MKLNLHAENSSPLNLFSKGISWFDDPILNRWPLLVQKPGKFLLGSAALCQCNKCFLKQVPETERERERNTYIRAALSAEQKHLIPLLKQEHFQNTQ